MARKTSGYSFFGSRAKAKEYPAPRNLAYERLLCEAIDEGRLVTLQYEDDITDRTFQPAAVYYSSQNKVCVSGTQITNPGKPMDADEPRNFEVGKIRSLRKTDKAFVATTEFDRFDKKYRKGIICPV